MVVFYAARHRLPAPSLARWLLGVGIAATLTANMAQGWSHGPVGAVVAAWPGVSLVGSYELLVWLIRTSGAVERGPSAGHLCNGAACSAWVRPFPTSASTASAPGGAESTPQTRRGGPAAQAAEQSAIPSRGQRDDEVPEASAVDEARRWPRTGSACQARQSAVGTPTRPDVRTHIPVAGRERENGRCTTSVAAPRLPGHRGHGLTAGPGGILASEPKSHDRRLTEGLPWA